MEKTISQKPYKIIMEYDGSKQTKSLINTNAQDGIETIIIGNITYLDSVKLLEGKRGNIFCKPDEVKKQYVDLDLKSYMRSIEAYINKCGLVYIAGERDLQIFMRLRSQLSFCANRSGMSHITRLMLGKEILTIAEKNERPELNVIFEELARFAKDFSDNTFFHAMNSLNEIGKMPIYVIRQNENGKYVKISHATPDGEVITEEEAKRLSTESHTIESVSEKSEKEVQRLCLDYLLDTVDLQRKKITDSLSDPHGEDWNR